MRAHAFELEECVYVDEQFCEEVERRRCRGSSVCIPDQLRQTELPLCV